MARTKNHATDTVTIAQLEAYINSVKYHDEHQYDMVRKATVHYMVKRAYPETTGKRLVKQSVTGTAATHVVEAGIVGKWGPLGVLGFATSWSESKSIWAKYLMHCCCCCCC
jgi:hypothetical protein